MTHFRKLISRASHKIQVDPAHSSYGQSQTGPAGNPQTNPLGTQISVCFNQDGTRRLEYYHDVDD